jgi:hypothetical protein
MELIVFGLANLAVLSIYLFRRLVGRMSRAQRDWLEAGLKAASEELEVQFAPRPPWSMRAAGEHGSYTVSIELRVELMPPQEGQEIAENVEFLAASVTGGLIPKGMCFTAERDSGDDVLIGDPMFDDVVEARGEPSVVLARLDEGVRKKVRRLVSDGGRLEDGRLVWHAPTRYLKWEIPDALRTLFDLARDLSSTDGGGLYQRLAKNACRDPVSGVRLWNLLALQERFGHSPEAHEASREDLQDPSPWVRLSAARFLREGERATLEGLARDPAVPDQAASEAIALFAARVPADEAGPFLVTVLKTRSGEARRQAIEELGRLGHAAAFGPLVVLLERSDPGTAAAAALSLGRLGGARAEPALLEAVASEARELRLAAARALESVGSAAAVEPLLSLLDAGRLDGESRQALRNAIAAIQSRLAGAEAAQLSLVTGPPEGGRLTLAQPGPGPGDLSPPGA